MNHDLDVIVIGGGPAGATASTLLAQQGRTVRLFERERFPRFHIGESLIPETYHVLKRLNMLDKLRRSAFVKKYSVQFVTERGKLSEPFYFMEHKPHESSQTWQVRRSEFDQMLLDNAREQGVDVHEGVRVLEVLFDGPRRRRPPAGRVGDRAPRECKSRRRCQWTKLADHKSPGFARLGPGPEKGRPVDLLARGLPRLGPR